MRKLIIFSITSNLLLIFLLFRERAEKLEAQDQTVRALNITEQLFLLNDECSDALDQSWELLEKQKAIRKADLDFEYL